MRFGRDGEAEEIVEADANALVSRHGPEAYWEARRRERDANLQDGSTHPVRTPAHWRQVALLAAKETGRSMRIGYWGADARGARTAKETRPTVTN
jgi:hypothetical protein